jgi:hypothetical protein
MVDKGHNGANDDDERGHPNRGDHQSSTLLDDLIAREVFGFRNVSWAKPTNPFGKNGPRVGSLG